MSSKPQDNTFGTDAFLADTSPTAKITRGDTTEEVAIEVLRDGKDEMNLVEHPFAMLSLGTNKGAVIDLSWEQRHPRTNKLVKSSWKVIGHPELGLPGPLEEKLYVVLMKLTREHGMQQVVPFSRGVLLDELGWTHCQKSYRQLEGALIRIGAVSIEAKNSFWNATAQNFDPLNQFALLDNVNIAMERPGRRVQGQIPLSSFRWNDVIFRSMTNGHLRSLDTSFALSLELPLALRLFRYLDKKRYSGRNAYEFDLCRLCEIHLGMTRNPYPSKYKERLAPAHEELLARGFLQSVFYVPMKTKKGEKVRYEFQSPTAQESLVLPIEQQTAAIAPNSEEALLKRLLAIKVTSVVATELLRTFDHEDIHLQLECLAERDAKNPAAVLIKAVREGWQLPGKYLERVEAQKRGQEAQTNQTTQKYHKAAQEASVLAEKALLEQESARLDVVWEQLDDSTRAEVEIQVHQRLGVLGQSGRAQGALVAMRRNLLRERLSK